MPTNRLRRLAAETYEYFSPNSPATASAKNVLPVPRGPCRRIPFRDTPYCPNLLASKLVWINSRICLFASSRPPTSANVSTGFLICPPCMAPLPALAIIACRGLIDRRAGISRQRTTNRPTPITLATSGYSFSTGTTTMSPAPMKSMKPHRKYPANSANRCKRLRL